MLLPIFLECHQRHMAVILHATSFLLNNNHTWFVTYVMTKNASHMVFFNSCHSFQTVIRFDCFQCKELGYSILDL